MPNEDSPALSSLACRAFVGLSITISVLGAFSKGLLPGALLTIAMGVCVYLLSISLGRLVYAWGRNWRLWGQTLLMAVGFGLIETNLNHIGLDNLNTQYHLVPATLGAIDLLWCGCFFISLVNVFATDTYTQDIEKPLVARPYPAKTHIKDLNRFLGGLKEKENKPVRKRPMPNFAVN